MHMTILFYNNEILLKILTNVNILAELSLIKTDMAIKKLPSYCHRRNHHMGPMGRVPCNLGKPGD